MRCEQALVRVCDGLREDGEVDWQIARAARVKIVRNSASMKAGEQPDQPLSWRI